MSVTKKPLPGADGKHCLAISYPLDWEKTQKIKSVLLFLHLAHGGRGKRRPIRPYGGAIPTGGRG